VWAVIASSESEACGDEKYHYQRQLLLQGVVGFQHQATEVQIADILTKDLGSKKRIVDTRCNFGKEGD
jgi:hypothetical protein